MTEIKCDRCKKVIAKNITIVSIVDDYTTAKRIDLCNECAKELKYWIYGEK